MPLRHLWSLAVEEQFYLLWPLIMVVILIRGRTHLPRVALWLFGVSVAIAVGDGRGAVRAGRHQLDVHARGDARVLEDRRAVHQHQRRAVPRHHHPRWRADDGRRVRDGVASGGAHARAHAQQEPSARRAWRCAVSSSSGYLFGSSHLADPGLTDRTDRASTRGCSAAASWLTGVGHADDHRRGHAPAVDGSVRCWAIRCSAGSAHAATGLYLYHWPIYQIIRKEAGLPLNITQFLVAMVVTCRHHRGQLSVHRDARSSRGHRQLAPRANDVAHRRPPSPADASSPRSVCSFTRRCSGGPASASRWPRTGASAWSSARRCRASRPIAAQLDDRDPPTATPRTTTTTRRRRRSPQPPVTPAETTTTATTAAPTTTVPVDQRPPIAVGESVMLGAKPTARGRRLHRLLPK